MATIEKKSLARRICDIYGECDPIEKKGKNTAQNYKFATESDVSDSLRGLMATHGVICFPSIEEVHERQFQTMKGAQMNFIRVKVKYTFINADDAQDRLELFWYGDGTDSMDKGIYKALTGANKYMLLRVFQVSTEDQHEPERDERGQGRAPPLPPGMANMSEDDDPPFYSDDLPPEDEPSDVQTYKYRVPFPMKDEAKKKGCRWNPESKSWDSTRVLPEFAAWLVGGDPDAQAQLILSKASEARQ